MGRKVQLRVSILLVIEDPMVQIQHLLHLEAFLLTFPEGMPIPGVQREAGATIMSTVQCTLKVSVITQSGRRRWHACPEYKRAYHARQVFST